MLSRSHRNKTRDAGSAAQRARVEQAVAATAYFAAKLLERATTGRTPVERAFDAHKAARDASPSYTTLHVSLEERAPQLAAFQPHVVAPAPTTTSSHCYVCLMCVSGILPDRTPCDCLVGRTRRKQEERATREMRAHHATTVGEQLDAAHKRDARRTARQRHLDTSHGGVEVLNGAYPGGCRECEQHAAHVNALARGRREQSEIHAVYYPGTPVAGRTAARKVVAVEQEGTDRYSAHLAAVDAATPRPPTSRPPKKCRHGLPRHGRAACSVCHEFPALDTCRHGIHGMAADCPACARHAF